MPSRPQSPRHRPTAGTRNVALDRIPTVLESTPTVLDSIPVPLRRIPIGLCALAVLSCGPGPAPGESSGTVGTRSPEPAVTAAHDPALADTLKRLIEGAYDFTQSDVVQRMSALYPDTGRVISASGGYVTASVAELRQGLAEFWSTTGVNMSDPRWEWGDVHVDRLSEDAAVLTANWSIPHIAPTGRPHTIRGAWTAVFVRADDAWWIIHEHLSVPPEDVAPDTM